MLLFCRLLFYQNSCWNMNSFFHWIWFLSGYLKETYFIFKLFSLNFILKSLKQLRIVLSTLILMFYQNPLKIMSSFREEILQNILFFNPLTIFSLISYFPLLIYLGDYQHLYFYSVTWKFYFEISQNNFWIAFYLLLF